MGGVAELQLLGQDVEVIFGTTFWGVYSCTSSVVEALEVLPPGSVFYLLASGSTRRQSCKFFCQLRHFFCVLRCSGL